MAVRFDMTIKLGDILVGISLAAALLLSWVRMDSRLVTIEISMNEQKQIVANQAEVVRLLSLNVQQLSTLAGVYVPRIEELSREAREGRNKQK